MRRTVALSWLAALALGGGGACATSGGTAPGPAAPGPAGAAASDVSEARCARGFPVACRDLGRAHLGGERPRDDRLAAAYATKACEIGEASGCADLAVLAAIGRSVVQRREARKNRVGALRTIGSFTIASPEPGIVSVRIGSQWVRLVEY